MKIISDASVLVIERYQAKVFDIAPQDMSSTFLDIFVPLL
jgi:hypothetical protein